MTEFIRVTNKFGYPVALNKNSIRRVWVGRDGHTCIDFGEQFPEAVTDSFDAVSELLGVEGTTHQAPLSGRTAYKPVAYGSIPRDDMDDEVTS